MTSLISHTERKRRKHGDPYIIERQIFYQGVVYQIQEEIYSDKDHSSIYTSEDSFEEEKQLPRRFRDMNPQISDLASSVSKSMTTPKGNLLKRFATGKSFKEKVFDTSAMSPAVILEDDEAQGREQASNMGLTARDSKN